MDVQTIIDEIKSENEIELALNEAKRLRFLERDRLIFDKKYEAYTIGLEGQKLIDWKRQMCSLLIKYDQNQPQRLDDKFDRLIYFDKTNASNHFCATIDTKKEKYPQLFFITGDVEDLPMDTIERLKVDFRKTSKSSKFWPENPEEDFDAIDLSSDKWKWRLHKQMRNLANVEDELNIAEYSPYIEKRFDEAIFLTLDIWEFEPAHFISFCEELHQLRFTELGKLTVVINFSITDDELVEAKKEAQENNLSYVHFYAPEEIKQKDFQRFFKMPRIFDSYKIVRLQPDEKITMLEAKERLKAAEKPNPLSIES